MNGSNKWYVLTGGPCAGKTTILHELKKKGYVTVPEVARAYIDRELSLGKTIEEIRADEPQFQRNLIQMKIDAEKELSPDAIAFFDRGMHDSEAYLKAQGVSPTPFLLEAMGNSMYQKVFLFEMLPLVQDGARTESPELAAKLHQLLGESYEAAGMPVIPVPVMSIKERLDFILNNL